MKLFFKKRPEIRSF